MNKTIQPHETIQEKLTPYELKKKKIKKVEQPKKNIPEKKKIAAVIPAPKFAIKERKKSLVRNRSAPKRSR